MSESPETEAVESETVTLPVDLESFSQLMTQVLKSFELMHDSVSRLAAGAAFKSMLVLAQENHPNGSSRSHALCNCICQTRGHDGLCTGMAEPGLTFLVESVKSGAVTAPVCGPCHDENQHREGDFE